MQGRGKGWVTAEYGMLPASTGDRKQRDISKGRADGRTVEIQRLIGRALRGVVDFEALGERTVWIDCDVLEADGGTRCASITGGFVALELALRGLVEKELLTDVPLSGSVAAVSCGVVDGTPLLDLDYPEDSNAEVDMNVVMTGDGGLVEVQATGERTPLSRTSLDALLELAAGGDRAAPGGAGGSGRPGRRLIRSAPCASYSHPATPTRCASSPRCSPRTSSCRCPTRSSCRPRTAPRSRRTRSVRPAPRARPPASGPWPTTRASRRSRSAGHPGSTRRASRGRARPTRRTSPSCCATCRRTATRASRTCARWCSSRPTGGSVSPRGAVPAGSSTSRAATGASATTRRSCPTTTDDGRTMAELSPAEKDAISHRGRAARLLLRELAAEAPG